MPQRSAKSPFPGMDPYLERHWSDVHQALCTYARDQIQAQLTGNLIARLGERLVVESIFGDSRSIYPDVRVVEHGLRGFEISTTSVAAASVAEPLVVEVASDPEPQGFVEIIEPDSGTLVTAIEFLSPSNKLGSGRAQYNKKQQELSAARVSLVEVDLIRAGERNFIIPQAQIPPSGLTTYMICVNRGYRSEKFELYPIPLSHPIRAIRVPLRETDADIVLDIQPLIDQAYKNGRYDRTDYRQPCIPPLEGEDAAWAAQLLAAR